METEDFAKLAAELLVKVNPLVNNQNWRALETTFQKLGLDPVQSTHAIYKAAGPDAVCAYVDAVHKDFVWGDCPDCEREVPTYPCDENSICLICWSSLLPGNISGSSVEMPSGEE
jgi:hypothetical protein